MTDPTDCEALEEEFSKSFAQELAALEEVPPIIASERRYEPAKFNRTGLSAKYLALEDELNRLSRLPVPENEAECDTLADQIIDLERQQFEMTGPTQMCGFCFLRHSE